MTRVDVADYLIVQPALRDLYIAYGDPAFSLMWLLPIL